MKEYPSHESQCSCPRCPGQIVGSFYTCYDDVNAKRPEGEAKGSAPYSILSFFFWKESHYEHIITL